MSKTKWLWPLTGGVLSIGAWALKRRRKRLTTDNREGIDTARALLATRIQAAEESFAELRAKVEASGESVPEGTEWTFGGASPLVIPHKDLNDLSRQLAEIRGLSATAEARTKTVSVIVVEQVAEWADVAVKDVLPLSNELCNIFSRGRNVECTKDSRAALIGSLKKIFTEADLEGLTPQLLASGKAVSTVTALIKYVAGSR